MVGFHASWLMARPPAICRNGAIRSACVWWSQTGSNRRPPACKAGALPTELWPRQMTDVGRRRSEALRSDVCHLTSVIRLVGLGRFELPTSRLSSARSNQLSYKPGSDVGCRMTEIRRFVLISVICHPTSDIRSSSFAKKEKRRRRRPALCRMTDVRGPKSRQLSRR
jgi:hypothetical protein